MNKNTLRICGLLVFMFLIITDTASAQRRKKRKKKDIEEVEVSIYDVDTLIHPIPLNRSRWHDKIDEQQRLADAADGRVDGRVSYGDDKVISDILTSALMDDVDHMQIMVENFPADSMQTTVNANQTKILYLRALEGMVHQYNFDASRDPYYYDPLVENMEDVIIAHYENRLGEFIRNNISWQTLDNTAEFTPSDDPNRALLYKEMGKREPEKMIKRVSEFYNHPYVCDIVKEAAKVVPNEVFNYATSTNLKYSSAVLRCDDKLVQTIVRIAQQSKSPLRAMPFLNDIYTGKKTIAQIDQITADEDLFYQNLVRLKLENVSLGGDTYTSELKYRGKRYVREMNDLHESPDKVRFKCINGFPPEVLYFIMVYGQDEIYTSSFLGTFNRMMERMGEMKGNELLEKVHRDKFRTFIRMCAGYNTLNDFMATIEPDKRNVLMRDFVAGLEKGKQDDLEDAVDVADAFGSIKDTALADFLRAEVKSNFERSYKEKSKKGVIVYGLLATLFENSKQVDSGDVAEQQSEKLQLPPINLVPYNNLTNDSGVVYEQFFFYGDEDGKNSFASFLGNFRDGSWRVEKSNYWTKITSTKGKPVVIYANMPLAEPEDEVAQEELCQYLAKEKITPTVIVHRGHSYHLPLTLERLNKKTRIVMLGSCGGYHNLATVLDKSPDANIISSKQTGAMSVNDPILKNLNDQLLAGNDINWIKTWQNLNGYFEAKPKSVKEMFDDYVPPHKNLGAIFIKAYRRLFHTGTIN